ncbi:MAG TPA: hypothetical protein VF624_05505 [Tepidisphaeraceae bacterium]
MSYVGVIYRFSTPSGKTYVGWHACDPTEWPDAGLGRLPDGYGGSGKYMWRAWPKYGDTIRWEILECIPLGMDWQPVERRLIAVERECVGRRCMNIGSGGQGCTSDDAKRLWADPEYRAKVRRGMSTPKFRVVRAANVVAGLRRFYADPVRSAPARDSLKQRAAKMNEQWADPARETTLRHKLGTIARERMQKLWTDPAFRERVVAQLRASQRQGNNNGGKGKKVAAAIRRRDGGERPWPEDNALLAERNEPLNQLSPRPPVEPEDGSKKAVVLALLRRCDYTSAELATAIDGTVYHARDTINNLKGFGHDIRWRNGHYTLVRPI